MVNEHTLNDQLFNFIEKSTSTPNIDEKVIDIIEQGAEINGRNVHLQTPLMIAAEKLDQRLVKILISKGADVHLKDNKDNTALHKAFKSASIIKLLLESGADINAKNIYGETVLLKTASRCGRRIDIGSFKFLIEQGADISVVDNDGYTPLSGFLCLNDTNNARVFDFVKLMLDYGVDPNIPNVDNETALVFAQQQDLEDVIELLMSYKENALLNNIVDSENNLDGHNHLSLTL